MNNILTQPSMSTKTSARKPKKSAVNFCTIIETATSANTLRRLYSIYSAMEPSTAQPPENYRDAENISKSGHCSAKQVLAAVFELAAPKNYLEIGTRRGHSLCVAVCSAPAPFDVYSFDMWIPNYGGEENPGPDLVRKELAKFSFEGKFNVSLGDSAKTVPTFFSNPNNPQLFDVIYVDGDHSDEGARRDLENTVKHLAPGGFLLFDDITHPKHMTLLKVWKDFVAAHPELEDVVEPRYEYGWALARRRAENSVAAQIISTPPVGARTITGTFQRFDTIQTDSIRAPQPAALTRTVKAGSPVHGTARTTVRNIVISGTNFWNPGDDFVREGIIRILREVFPGEQLNFLFYNFNADFFPQSKFSGIADFVSEGDLNKYREDIDAIVIAGLPVGDEMKDLYYWITSNGLEEKVYLIGAGYESNYVAEHISQEPEATIFRKARIVTGRTAKTPEFFASENIRYHHINCPAILSVPAVKEIAAGKQIERIGFSIQLPHGDGVPNHTCAAEMYDLSVQVLRELSRQYQVEVIAHHKSEYFHFLNLLRDEGIPVIFSSFYRDLFAVYPRYDLIITTRLHASLFGNGHGIPGIIINDTDRHTHTLQGFPHSTWVNNRQNFDNAFAHWSNADLTAIARESENFKSLLSRRYLEVLRPVFAAEKKSVAPNTSRRSEVNPATLARRVEYGKGVHLQEGATRWISNLGELRLPTQHLSDPVNLTFELCAGDLWCYGRKYFQTTIRLDGAPIKRLRFDRDGQHFDVSIPLEPKQHGQVLTIESDASFVPAQIDNNSRDQRCLAVKLSKLLLSKPSETVPAPATPPASKPVNQQTVIIDQSPSTATHKPEFLWNPTRNELITTKFMRNRVLFSTLADRLLPELRKQKGGPLKILFWACSTGCEPYTLKFLLGPSSTDEIVGIDFDAEAIRHANQAIYNPSNWTLFFDEQKNLLNPDEIHRLFDHPDASAQEEFRVAAAYRDNISFLAGDLFSATPVVPFKSFDVVVCNNLLIHMKPHSASLAWDCLSRYVTDDGLLVVGGCNPSVKLEATKRLGLQPCSESLSEISKNWSGVSGAWNFNPRPAWAYPAPDEKSSDYPLLAGEIFRKNQSTH
jgi:chemotaxis methyl-accepting protein methylase/predicted O-methyltransferase YrrM